MELLMRYFVGTEIGVVNLLQRHFCWTSNSLWFEEIPSARDPHRTKFLLGGKDDIIHSEVRLSHFLYIYVELMESVARQKISYLSWCSKKLMV